MTEQIKKNLKIIEILNEASQKCAVPSAEIAEFKQDLDSFEREWNKFSSFLNTKMQVLDPNDVEEVKAIILESWRYWDEVERIIYDFDDLIRKLSKYYLPPDPDAALAYTTWGSHTPLELAKMEAEMEPLKHLKVREETFNFTYIKAFVQLSQGFLINCNSSELIVFNPDLTLQKKISLPSPFCFEYWPVYKKFNADEVIFFGEEHEYVLYVNVETSTCTFIENKQFPVPELWPGSIYYWKDDDLIIHDDNVFYRINPYENVIEQLDTSYIKRTLPDFYEYYLDSLKYETGMTYRGINRVYAATYSFTYHDFEHHEVGLRNSKEKTTRKIRFHNEEAYDIKVYKDYFVFIEEEKIEIRKGRKRTQIFPNPSHTFLAAELFENNNKLYVMCVARHVSMGLGSSIMLYRIANTFDELIRDDPKRQLNNTES